MTIATAVSRAPRPAVQLGVLIGERAGAPSPLAGARLSWFAANVLALGGVALDGEAPAPDVDAIILPRAERLAALAVMALAPIAALGPSFAQVAGLARVPRWHARELARPPVVLLSVDDLEERWRFRQRVLAHVTAVRGSAAGRVTQLRVRWRAVA
jgi:hypothetical protein